MRDHQKPYAVVRGQRLSGGLSGFCGGEAGGCDEDLLRPDGLCAQIPLLGVRLLAVQAALRESGRAAGGGQRI